MSEEERVKRKKKRQNLKREALLDAAETVLIRDGVEAFTIPAVAKQANLTKTAVYYYFPSKESVMEQLFVRGFTLEVETLRAAVLEAPPGIPCLQAFFRAKVDFYKNRPDAYNIVYVWPQFFKPSPGLLTECIYPASWAMNDLLEKKLASGPGPTPSHPRRLANLAFLTAQGILSTAMQVRALGGDMRFSVEELVEEFNDLLDRSGAVSGKDETGLS